MRLVARHVASAMYCLLAAVLGPSKVKYSNYLMWYIERYWLSDYQWHQPLMMITTTRGLGSSLTLSCTTRRDTFYYLITSRLSSREQTNGSNVINLGGVRTGYITNQHFKLDHFHFQSFWTKRIFLAFYENTCNKWFLLKLKALPPFGNTSYFLPKNLIWDGEGRNLRSDSVCMLYTVSPD